MKRVIAIGVIAAGLLPGRWAEAEGSTIELIPKSKRTEPPRDGEAERSERERRRAPERGPASMPTETAPEPRDEGPSAPEDPAALDLRPDPAPAGLDPKAATPPRRRRLRVMPFVGIGLSIAAGVAGGLFLAEAARNLDPANYVLDVEGSGDDLEVELSDAFVDAQSAVIGNGLAGAILVSTASAGLLASLLSLTAD